jgi:peptidoglycan/LPS O-acetylase OafA/YrhL
MPLPSLQATSTAESRIPELDGLRGIAVGMVLVWHFIGALLDPALGAWARWTYHLTILGRTGVDLFFVLSGFLITGIILDRQQRPAGFLGSFYLRRLLRIVPSYALLIAIFWFVASSSTIVAGHTSAFGAETPWWRHATFTQNLWMSDFNRWGPGAISVTWSVAIEEQFYLVFPLLALWMPRRWLPILLVGIVVGSCLHRAHAWISDGNAFRMYVHTLSRLDGLAVGALIAWLWREQWFGPWLEERAAAMVRTFKVLCMLLPVLAIALKVNLPLAMSSWGHTYLTVFYAICLLMVLHYQQSPQLVWLRTHWLRGLGAVSYTVYLFHPLLLSFVFLAAFRQERISSLLDATLALSALLLTLAWSSISLRMLERPLTQWGRRWRY